MKKMKIFYIFESLMSAILLGIYVFLYPQLPSELPTHWSSKGVVDGTTSKESFFVLPIVLLFMGIVFSILENSNIKKGKVTPRTTNIGVILFIVTIFMVTAGLVTYFACHIYNCQLNSYH
mgnify:FL=1